MKRIVLLLSLAIFCAAAVCWGIPHYRLAQEKARRHAGYEQMLADSKPLVLDAATQAILNGADRVETFRLADFHEEEYYTEAEREVLDRPHPQYLDDHEVIRVGPPQDRAFAAHLIKALSQADGNGGTASCFDPGVGFRVWKGKAHVDICVCFTCAGIQLISSDAHNKVLLQTMAVLGSARPVFLALSQQAFPDDKRLASLKPVAE